MKKKSVYIETTIPSLRKMTKYKELESPIEEVYRIREEILKKFNYDVKAYHRHLRKTKNKWVKAGFHFADES